MSHNPAIELASAIQSASIKRHPSPHHDINPSTAASRKIPGEIVSPPSTDPDSDDDTSTIPSDIIRPRPRRKSFPPLPDFRFEQSYLASIKAAESNTQVMLITLRDQLILPLAQGVLWNMAMFGWRFWNRDTQFKGQGLGARVRKWWWGVNNWAVPRTGGGREKGSVGEVGEYYMLRKYDAEWRSLCITPSLREDNQGYPTAIEELQRRYLRSPVRLATDPTPSTSTAVEGTRTQAASTLHESKSSNDGF